MKSGHQWLFGSALHTYCVQVHRHIQRSSEAPNMNNAVPSVIGDDVILSSGNTIASIWYEAGRPAYSPHR
jgi:hypothetical protein